MARPKLPSTRAGSWHRMTKYNAQTRTRRTTNAPFSLNLCLAQPKYVIPKLFNVKEKTGFGSCLYTAASPNRAPYL